MEMTFVQGGAVLLVIVLRCCIDAQSITNTTLHDGDVACANTDVTFTCETLGSTAIAWRSENFIGAGNTAQLVFSFDVDNPGSTRQGIDSTTVATLTRNEVVNGARLLQSTLRVRAPESSTTSLSVTCVHLDNDVDMSVTFSVLSTPGAVVNAFSDQVRCNDSSMCLVISSWNPPLNSVNTTNFSIYVNGTIILSNRDNFSVMPTNEGPQFSYAYVVPTCNNHNINITASNICGEGPPTFRELEGPDNTVESRPACGARVTTLVDMATTTNDSKRIKCFVGEAGALLYGIVMLTMNGMGI